MGVRVADRKPQRVRRVVLRQLREAEERLDHPLYLLLLGEAVSADGLLHPPGLVLVHGKVRVRRRRQHRAARFAEDELKAREEAFLPPFCHLAVVGVKSRDLRLAGDWATMYAASLKKLASPGFVVSEAMPSALEKADGWYRWQVVLRATSPSAIVKAWRWISSVRPPPKSGRISVDVDAQSF